MFRSSNSFWSREIPAANESVIVDELLNRLPKWLGYGQISELMRIKLVDDVTPIDSPPTRRRFPIQAAAHTFPSMIGANRHDHDSPNRVTLPLAHNFFLGWRKPIAACEKE